MTDLKEPRKATDVLLEIEHKLDMLIGAIQAQVLSQNIISNKLSDLLNSKPKESQKITVETVNTIAHPALDMKNLPVSSEDVLSIEERPTGFRRTSRPETYSGDNSYLNKPKKESDQGRFPIQIPRGTKAEVVIPQQTTANVELPVITPQIPKQNNPKTSSNSVPVIQRIVDKNGKALFLADIEIIDNNTTESFFKTRTNGAGKWMASLPVGDYTVVLRKRDSLTKEVIEISQTIQVDGLKSPMELPVCIIKN